MGKKKRRDSAETASLVPPQDADSASNAKKRAKLEKRKLAPENQPSFNFVLGGFRAGRPVTIKDVRELTLHLLSAPGSVASNWLQVNNRSNIDKVVSLFVPGITPESLGLNGSTVAANTSAPQSLAPGSMTSKLPIFSQLFSHYAPTRAPGDKYHLHSVLQTFVTVPMSDQDKQKRDLARQKQFEACSDPTIFLLQPEAMLDSLYTLPHYDTWLSIHSPDIPTSKPDFSAWTPSPPSSTAASSSVKPPPEQLPDAEWIQTPQCAADSRIKCYAMDCEMVRTEVGSELARITIVDRKAAVVYDTFVKPSAPVTDYATQWSGITPKNLEGVTTTLADVQKKLASLVDYKTILIGHSLENDLRAVKLAHPWIIDTALIYQHTRGPPFKPSLKWLASKWLSRDIQKPSTVPASGDGSEVIVGHDSEEDARTAMDLLNLKMVKGPLFGEFVTDQEVVFERIAKPPSLKKSAAIDHGTPGQWHGAKATVAVACTSDQEVVDGVMNELPKNDYVFARFMGLSHALKWSQPSLSVQARLPSKTDAASVDDAEMPDNEELKAAAEADAVKQAYRELNNQIKSLYQSLPPRTALVLFTGHSDPRRMGQLLSKKNKFDRLWKTVKPEQIKPEDKFMATEERELQEQVERAKMGMAFFACKST